MARFMLYLVGIVSLLLSTAESTHEPDNHGVCYRVVTECCPGFHGHPPYCVPGPVECDELYNLTNGEVAYSARTPGSLAVYTCAEGFVLKGDAFRTCEEDGEWLGSVPTCEPMPECSYLANPANGVVNQTGTDPGSQATYTCNGGFVVVGTATLVCQADGQWSGDTPTCTAKCSYLANPANGAVTQTGTSPGSQATYTCNGGFLVVGTATLVCQADGQWTGDAPTCTAIECSYLANPANGAVTQTGISPGSQATYTCNGGFVVVGTATLVCQADGQWSGDAPTCTANIPLWFNQTELCYKWRPDGDGGQCGAGEPRDLCATVGSRTQYYRDDTDRRSGGCRMQWAIMSPYAEPWFRRAQICYRWYADGNGGQCGGGAPNEMCAPVGSFTREYRDDTDRRSGGCRMSWKLSIPSNSPNWLRNVKLCYRWYPDGDGGQCGGGAARELCATANYWTAYYRDDTDRRSGGCRMSWGLYI